MELWAEDGTSPATRKRPPATGPGSGKDAWISYALYCEEANFNLQDIIERQREVIAVLNANVSAHERDAAARKPPGSRQRLPHGTMVKIMNAIREGQSTRSVATACGVSAMTVSRIGRRMKAEGAANRTT